MEYKPISNYISQIYLGPKVSKNDHIILDHLIKKESLDIKIKKSDLPLA